MVGGTTMAEIDQEYEVDLMEYFWILWRKKWIIIGLFVIAVVSAYFVTKTMTPIYKTSAMIMIEEDDGMQNLFAGEMFGGGNNKISTYSRMIKTRSFLEQVIKMMDLRNENGDYISVNNLKASITVSSIPGTDLLEIGIEDPNPEKAMKIINTLISQFEEQNIQMNRASMAGAREFMEKQKEKLERDLRKAEDQLLIYKNQNNVVLPTEQAKQTLDKLVEVEGLKYKAEIESGSIEASVQSIQQELVMQSEQTISSIVISQNPLIKEYKGQIAEMETQLVGLRKMYTSNHPEISRIESQIQELETALSQEVEEEVSTQTKTINPIYQSLNQELVSLEASRLANEAKVEGYNQLIKEYEGELEKLPTKELEVLRLERDAKVTGEIYTMLLTKAEEIKISEAMQTSDIYLVDPAYLPEHPIKPNKKMLILVAGFLAIFVGVGLILLLELMNTKVKNAEEIERMLNLPVLGSIPDINKMKKLSK